VNENLYGKAAIEHLARIQTANTDVCTVLIAHLVGSVPTGKKLLVFGSGHSALFALELYHRAGGASFVLPVIEPCLLPTAGPPVIRVLERTPGVALPALARALPEAGEMIWIASQSGINHAAVDVAMEAKRLGLVTVGFTSRKHSEAVKARHPSGKRLFEVCDHVVDLGGFVGDAAVPIGGGLQAGPLSTLGSVFLAHSILVAACRELEAKGHRCTYTSVNTPEGEARNHAIELEAAKRDPLLRTTPSKN